MEYFGFVTWAVTEAKPTASQFDSLPVLMVDGLHDTRLCVLHDTRYNWIKTEDSASNQQFVKNYHELKGFRTAMKLETKRR